MLWQEQDWKARESGILALGAISEGCASGLLHYLAEMVSALLPLLADTRPLVRSITCWALSRYSHWLVQAAEQAIPLAKEQLHSVLKVPLPHFPPALLSPDCECLTLWKYQASDSTPLTRESSIVFTIQNKLLLTSALLVAVLIKCCCTSLQ